MQGWEVTGQPKNSWDHGPMKEAPALKSNSLFFFLFLFLRSRQTFLKRLEFNMSSPFTYCANKNYTAERLGGGSGEFLSRGHFNLYWVEKEREKEGHTPTFRKLPDLSSISDVVIAKPTPFSDYSPHSLQCLCSLVSVKLHYQLLDYLWLLCSALSILVFSQSPDFSLPDLKEKDLGKTKLTI